MNDKTILIDDEIPAYKKKSTKKGQPRSKHKHIYETVLLTRNYHFSDFKTGRPKVNQTILPTKVCTICGRIDGVDSDPSYYVEKPVQHPLFVVYDTELSDQALSLPKWYVEDFWDKFAIKEECENSLESDVNGENINR